MSTDIPTWGVEQLTNKSFRDALCRDPDNIHGHVIIQFADGSMEVSKRMAFLNLFWMGILAEFNLPICKRHYIKRLSPSNSGLMKELTKYYEEVMGVNGGYDVARKFADVLWVCLYDLYKFCCIDIIQYSRSLDILDVAEIMTDESVKAIVDTRSDIKPELGTAAIEQLIDLRRDKLMKLFGTKGALSNDALYSYCKADQLNKFQLPQMMYAYGPRTDIDDTIVRYPVKGSAVEGLDNISEYAVESLSAKKSSCYNKNAVSDAQYFGRKQHLLASSILKIIPHDCGTTNYVRFNVDKRNHRGLIGKNIYQDDGTLMTVTADNAESLIGTTVKMRSPLTCRYRRGVCSVCGGATFRNISPNINLGILSAIQVIEQITQKILSSKHLIKTLSLVYQLPPTARGILTTKFSNEIYWDNKAAPNIKRYAIGFDISDIPRFQDISYISSDKPIREELFSKIRRIYLRNIKTGEVEQYQLDTGITVPDQLPYLSDKFLLHFRDHYQLDDTGEERVWVTLDGAEKLPLFKFVVVNDNMLAYVRRADRFLSTDLKSFTSCSAALQVFNDIVRDKVDNINMVHLEVLLKAYLISSATDYRVPEVKDPDNVIFGSCNAIISNRTIGTKLGYQALTNYLESASTYLTPKMKSPFDLFVGYDSY